MQIVFDTGFTPKPKKKEEIEKIKPATDEILFQAQCYLIDLIDTVAKSNFDTSYDYFRIIHGDPPRVLTNLFGTKNYEPFWSITPEQLAKLQPTAKLIKIEYDASGNEVDYVEFPFDEYMTTGDFNPVTNPSISRGGGVGLMSMDWDFKGSDPASATRIIGTNIKIRFETFDELTKKRKVTTKKGTTEISFLDLIAHQKKKEIDPCTSRDVFNPNYYSFKIIVGWSDPRELDSNQHSTMSKLAKVINNDRKTIILTLARHNLEYTNEGVVYLTLDCNGRYDVATILEQSDVFLPYKKKFNFDEEEDGLIRESSSLRAIDDCNTIDSRNEKRINELKDKRKEILLKKSKHLALTKSEIYSSFMNDLINKKRIFCITVPEEYTNLELDLDLLGWYGSGRARTFESLSRDDSAKKREKLLSAPQIKVTKYTGESAFANKLKTVGEEVNRGDEDVTTEAKVDDLRKANEDILYDNFKSSTNSLTIPFVYFGDIINFALKTVHGGNKYINSKYKSLVTDIVLYNPRLSKKLSINIADVPISLTLFQDWFIDNIYSKQLTSYPARQFLQDLFSGLLSEALGSKGCYSSIPKRNTKIGFMEYTIGTESDTDPLDPLNCGRLHVSTVREIRSKSSRSSEADFYTYSVFYLTEADISSWKTTTPEEDYKKGVPWLTLGRDRGLVKTIDFTRNDIPYMREANLFNSDPTDGLEVLREVYTANIEMVGNNFLYPGAIIYINPSTVILGNPANVSSIAARIGLVGYYMVQEVKNSISPGKFSTTVKAIWQAGGSGRSGDSYIMQDKDNKGELAICDCTSDSVIVKTEEVNKINWSAVETIEISPDKKPGCEDK
jgi:hypothetical protein